MVSYKLSGDFEWHSGHGLETSICWFCHILTLCMQGNLLSSAGLFKINLSENSFRNTISVKQFWILISTDTLVQTVCKGYQQMTKVATSKERVNVLCVIHIWKFLIHWCVWEKNVCMMNTYVRYMLFSFELGFLWVADQIRKSSFRSIMNPI